MHDVLHYLPYAILLLLVSALLVHALVPDQHLLLVLGDDLESNLAQPMVAQQQTPNIQYAAVAVYSIDPSWWALDGPARENEGGKFLAVLLDAEGKQEVRGRGIDGLAWENPGFILVLKHHNLLALRRVMADLARLPASQWFHRMLVFYGRTTAENVNSIESPSNAAVILEARSRDWFLLTEEKQAQLSSPRVETLFEADVGSVQVFAGLGSGTYSDLLLLEGITLDDLSKLRRDLRGHWEQKYITDSRTYVGPFISSSNLLDGLR